MKFYIKNLTVIMLLFSISGFAKDATKVKSYYYQINNAELSICDNDLKGAYQSYSNAYKIFGEDMNSKNLFNFLLVAIELKKDNTCINILRELKSRGLLESAFIHIMSESLPDIKSARLRKLYASSGIVKAKFDPVYMAKIDSIVHVDQTTNKYLRSLNEGLLNAAAMDSFGKLTNNNLIYLYKLFSEKFPTDAVGGVADNKSGFPSAAILIHNQQCAQSHTLDNILYQGVLNGDFDPSAFEYYMSDYFSKNIKILKLDSVVIGWPLLPIGFQVVKDSLLQFKLICSDEITANQNRMKIMGLCTVDEMIKKIIYQYYNPKYRFVYCDIPRINFDLPKRVTDQLIYIPKPNK